MVWHRRPIVQRLLGLTGHFGSKALCRALFFHPPPLLQRRLWKRWYIQRYNIRSFSESLFVKGRGRPARWGLWPGFVASACARSQVLRALIRRQTKKRTTSHTQNNTRTMFARGGGRDVFRDRCSFLHPQKSQQTKDQRRIGILFKKLMQLDTDDRPRILEDRPATTTNTCR